MGVHPPHLHNNLNKKPIINNQIRAEQVRVIDETGKQLEVMGLEKALQLARERNLDLIQITEKVDPPVCKIIDYGKYLYQLKKKDKGIRQKSGSETKGIRLRFNISDHDLEVRAHQAEKFFKEGHRIRIELVLRGREKALEGFAREKFNKFLEILRGIAPYKIDRELKKEPRGLTMIISKQ